MSPIRCTLTLAGALGVQVERAELEALYRGLGAELSEWSINPEGHARGRLRLSAWTRDYGAAARWLEARGAGALLALRREVPREDLEGVGLAWGQGAARLRWWQLAPSDGTALAAAAGRLPALVEARAALAADCGGPRRIRALGAEADEQGLVRLTLYASAPEPAAALAALERAGVCATERARRFFYELVGMGRRPWPKLWIARSVGRGGGWKFYLFLRGEPARPPDEAALALADGRARAAVEGLGRRDIVQLAALTFADDASPGEEPGYTLYLAER